MNSKIIRAVLILIIVLAGSFAAYNLYGQRFVGRSATGVSSIMAKLSSQEIVSQSDGVVVGTVEKTDVIKAPSTIRVGKDDIVTKATISVEKYLFNPKNLTGNEIVIQTIGGTIGNQSMASDDTQVLKNGQRIVAFLRQTKDGTFTIFGGRQGEYTINEDGSVGAENERGIFTDVFGKQMNLDELGKTVASIAKAVLVK